MDKEKVNIQHTARKLIRYVRQHEKHVVPNEIDMMWKRVEERAVIENRIRDQRRRLLYWTTFSSAAAILFCMFWVGKQFMANNADNNAITLFVQSTQPCGQTNEEILLLMPGKEEIKIGETDVNVIYSKNGIVMVNADTVNQTGMKNKELEFNQLITPKGKRTCLTLSDGTHLWINSGTRVIYPSRFGKNCREIYVEGEIYLNVTRSEDIPFMVRTRDFQVEVLGTSFNVSSYPSEEMSSVVLVEGSVSIQNQEKKHVELVPGQLVDIQAQTGRLYTPRNVDVEQYVCWVKNMLMYMDEPLDKVFKKLNLYYGKEFVLETGIAELQVTGKLDLKDKLEDVLHTIAFSAPIYYEETDGKIYVRKE